MQIPFTKMHGLGNDFMVIDMISHPVQLTGDQIRQLADRNFGIGFDQLLMVAPPTLPDVDFNYRIFNADGGEVEHCGNGARCFARFVLDKKLIARTPVRVKTLNGILELDIQQDGQVKVDMGLPDFDPASLPLTAARAPSYQLTVALDGGRPVEFFAVSVGNPHAVMVVDDVDTAPVHELGPVLGAHAAFPKGVNVGFMQIIDRRTIRLRVFERGAGETIACGTGACAAAICGMAAGLLDREVTAHLRGGDLNIRWADESAHMIMTGPATTVYEGTVKL